jgi:hypothetical protein
VRLHERHSQDPHQEQHNVDENRPDERVVRSERRDHYNNSAGDRDDAEDGDELQPARTLFMSLRTPLLPGHRENDELRSDGPNHEDQQGQHAEDGHDDFLPDQGEVLHWTAGSDRFEYRRSSSQRGVLGARVQKIVPHRPRNTWDVTP